MADSFMLKNDGGSQFSPHPEGQYPAVCVDFLDLGNRVKSYPGAEPKLAYCVALVFQTGEQNEGGRLHEVSAEFTASMHEKASLRKLLEDWRGKTYTKDEVKQGIPADKLVGRPCLLTVEHKESGSGRVYAKIRGIGPLPKAMTTPTLPKYERPQFWTERKTAYKAEAEKFERDHGLHKDFESVPPPDDSDLPW